jgi:hypothetical protein
VQQLLPLDVEKVAVCAVSWTVQNQALTRGHLKTHSLMLTMSIIE